MVSCDRVLPSNSVHLCSVAEGDKIFILMSCV